MITLAAATFRAGNADRCYGKRGSSTLQSWIGGGAPVVRNRRSAIYRFCLGLRFPGTNLGFM